MSAPAKPLPIPATFAFEWPEPGMQALYWSWDQMHNPHPATPLTATFEAPSFSEGSSRGFHAIGIR
jgi:hypothetical protein